MEASEKSNSEIPPHVRALMIDDDHKLFDLLSEYLPRFQIEVVYAANGLEGLKMLEEKKPDLVILDVMMPEMDGFQTCREICKKTDTPILMLSARGDTTDKIIGLELGADDYMAKPFEPRELVSRIHSIIRRTGTRIPRKENIMGDLEIRRQVREAFLDEKPLGLTGMEFELLSLFMQYPGRKFSRDEIMNHLQGFESNSYSRSVDILVSRLRTKLGESARNPKYIKSIHGFGYVFIGNIR